MSNIPLFRSMNSGDCGRVPVARRWVSLRGRMSLLRRRNVALEVEAVRRHRAAWMFSAVVLTILLAAALGPAAHSAEAASSLGVMRTVRIKRANVSLRYPRR